MSTDNLTPLFSLTDSVTDLQPTSVTDRPPTRQPIGSISVPTDRGADRTDGRTDGLTEKNSPTETASRNASPAGGHPESTLDTHQPAELTIRVIGEVVQQGSMTPYTRAGKPYCKPANEAKLKPWRKHVAEAARATARRERWTRLDGAIEVGIVFFLERPPSAPRRRIWPEKYPDIDKCVRAILDGLTDSGAIVDDARIIHIDAWQRYAPTGVPLGARITIRNGVDERRPVVSPRARSGGAS